MGHQQVVLAGFDPGHDGYAGGLGQHAVHLSLCTVPKLPATDGRPEDGLTFYAVNTIRVAGVLVLWHHRPRRLVVVDLGLIRSVAAAERRVLLLVDTVLAPSQHDGVRAFLQYALAYAAAPGNHVPGLPPIQYAMRHLRAILGYNVGYGRIEDDIVHEQLRTGELVETRGVGAEVFDRIVENGPHLLHILTPEEPVGLAGDVGGAFPLRRD